MKEELQEHLEPEGPSTSLQLWLHRSAPPIICGNQKRPKKPKDINFKWVKEALPTEFVQQGLKVGTARHILLFTTEYDNQKSSILLCIDAPSK